MFIAIILGVLGNKGKYFAAFLGAFQVKIYTSHIYLFTY